MGRPPIGKKAATLYAIRLPGEIAKEIKAYAKANGLKSQSEAIRRMIDVALENELLKEVIGRIDKHAESRGEMRTEVMRRCLEAGLAAEIGGRKGRK